MVVVVACLTVERSSLKAFVELWKLRSDAHRRRQWVLGRRTVSPRRIQSWFRKRGRVEEMDVN
jgi:hypothetical protein